jgi:cell division protein FtsI/penicillin-binding protein 2
MPHPKLVSKVITEDREILTKVRPAKQVIKPESARALTAMMIRAVEAGEARRLVQPGYRIAGKTGTAQVPIAGHYDPNKTIASFVGFAPAEDPKFVMIVKYVEPTTTPHGATTAVPTFMAITRDLFGYFGLAPTP